MTRFPSLSVALAILLGLFANRSFGQDQPFNVLQDLGGIETIGGFGGGGDELILSGELKVAEGGRDGVLTIKGVLAPKWHTYAVDQQGGPGPSKISVKSDGKLQVLAAFQPDSEPKVRDVEEFDVPLREHYGQVTWTAPVRLADGVKPEELQLDVEFNGQACHDEKGCKPIFGEPIDVKFAGYLPASAKSLGEVANLPETPAATEPAVDVAPPLDAAEFQPRRGNVTLRGHVEPAVVPPGGTAKLVITATPALGYHVYTYWPTDVDAGPFKHTLIAVDQPATWTVDNATTDAQPQSKVLLEGDPPVSYHESPVTWTMPIHVPNDALEGQHSITGAVGIQTCQDNFCDPPAGASFTANIIVGSAGSAAAVPVSFADASYGTAAQLAESRNSAGGNTGQEPNESSSEPGSGDGQLDLANLDTSADVGQDRSFVAVLLFAFFGGLILNLMPCVLPVIGLKILSFVQQAGESRARIFALNVWYSLGVLAVFMFLATLAFAFSMGQGEHLNDDRFSIPFAAVVFVMALSFIGVWEIPIPGFASSNKANELASKEGPAGAFAKGIIATILGTACSGPGIAIALAWCAGKPGPVVYGVFSMMALGMAFPYLLIGMFPKLIRFLPKPGAWMETFKQTMGFVLLGTVIFILKFISWSNVLPAITLMFGLWAACWWIGRTPITAEFPVRLRAWLSAAAFATAVGVFAFTTEFGWGQFDDGLRGMMESKLAAYVDQRVQKELDARGVEELDPEKPWQPFSTQRLSAFASQNRTVMVDFTADWCMTCKFLEETVLHTEEVDNVINENGIVTMVADWSDYGEEVGQVLESLGSKQVPVIAIFPAGRPNQPIVLIGGYTKNTLLGKLREAGPSAGLAQHDEPPAATMATR